MSRGSLAVFYGSLEVYSGSREVSMASLWDLEGFAVAMTSRRSSDAVSQLRPLSAEIVYRHGCRRVLLLSAVAFFDKLVRAALSRLVYSRTIALLAG